MDARSLGQREIDELLNSIDSIKENEFAPPKRYATDIKTFIIPFISRMKKVIIKKVRERYLVIVLFSNNLNFVEYFDRRIIKDDIFTYDMKQSMFLSIPYECELDNLQTHDRESWTVDEVDRIKIRTKVA